jgi:RNA polymerase sigma-54 factor
MALEQKLSLKLAQRLVMTPSLQQAIKLLQMTRLELEGVLTQELVENPVLEETAEEPEKSETETETEETDSQEAMDEIDLDAYFNEYLDGPDYAQTRTFEPREAVPLENTLTRQPDLYDHLLWQLSMSGVSPLRREIAELIIGNLDTDGFLVASVEEIQALGAAPILRLPVSDNGESPKARARAGGSRGDTEPASDGGNEAPAAEQEHAALDEPAPEGETAEEAVAEKGEPDQEGELSDEDLTRLAAEGYAREEVEGALALVRNFDPSGIAWPDLRQTLLAQLRALDEEESLAYRVVEQHWPLFLKRQFQALARELPIPLAELEPAVDLIRSLETRPGRKFTSERTQYVEPDVVIVKVGGDYVIQLNDDGLPRLRVSKAYRRMLQNMRREGKQAEAQQFIKDKMRSAIWLIKSLDQRQRTIYKVAESIVRQQREFLDHGIDYLRPMVLRDVAEDIGMHESTVSRVVSNKYMHTPRGIFPMKFFFHSGIDRNYGEDISSLTVKRKIKNLIEAEDSRRPLSDSELMRMLNREGINIARRTVAKYRDELGIPSSTDRKQVF